MGFQTPVVISPTNIMDISTIAQFISELVSRTPSFIRGSSLGSTVQSQFPGLNLRLQYGGLRRFIEDHCHTVEWRQKDGGDDIYAEKGREVFLPGRGQMDRESVSPNVWKIFSNPSIEGFLLYHRPSHRIFFSPARVSSSEVLEIPRFTNAEQKQLIAEFVAAKIPQHAQVVKTVLDSYDYWTKWFMLMNTLDGGIHRATWITARNAHLQQIFESRLRSLGLGDDEIVECRQQLARQPGTYSTPSHLSAGLLTTREIASKAIAQMSDEQLRAMMFPLGVIMDAVTGSRTQSVGEPGAS